MFENDIKSADSFSETKSFTTCPTLFSSYDENISSTNIRGSSGMSTTAVEDHYFQIKCTRILLRG
ncbi:hypothetical protein HanHA300_Chr16g0630921 [Helianthus annuus]|nr:hypothetical protein HanHA300_Chr16g0630921 [Helianthus annuus]KAJ0462320.1 hypothetical protein HanHA89_Chr16g0682121 [Helianthus annuus]KAJ0646596.1 hypothetical protein HanOQP8_Chr16g0636951 [Helianthus annuus]